SGTLDRSTLLPSANLFSGGACANRKPFTGRVRLRDASLANHVSLLVGHADWNPPNEESLFLSVRCRKTGAPRVLSRRFEKRCRGLTHLCAKEIRSVFIGKIRMV